jgi:hypothetical protein
MSLDLSQVVFNGKNLEDLVKEVYDNHKSQDQLIKTEITRLATMISNPGDAVVIIPMLKGLMDSSLKNDETILKLVNVFQKAAEGAKKGDSEDGGLLTERDVQQLFEEINVIKAPKEKANVG